MSFTVRILFLTTASPTFQSHPHKKISIHSMAPNGDASRGDFKDRQFAETEVGDKVVEQCELSNDLLTASGVAGVVGASPFQL